MRCWFEFASRFDFYVLLLCGVIYRAEEFRFDLAARTYQRHRRGTVRTDRSSGPWDEIDALVLQRHASHSEDGWYYACSLTIGWKARRRAPTTVQEWWDERQHGEQRRFAARLAKRSGVPLQDRQDEPAGE